MSSEGVAFGSIKHGEIFYTSNGHRWMKFDRYPDELFVKDYGEYRRVNAINMTHLTVEEFSDRDIVWHQLNDE